MSMRPRFDSLPPLLLFAMYLVQCNLQVLANERVRRSPPYGLGLVWSSGGAARHLDGDTPEGRSVPVKLFSCDFSRAVILL